MSHQSSYQCNNCGKKFIGPPGPIICPFCANNYVVWLNYEELFGSRQKQKY